jgi:hypothetical protein
VATQFLQDEKYRPRSVKKYEINAERGQELNMKKIGLDYKFWREKE